MSYAKYEVKMSMLGINELIKSFENKTKNIENVMTTAINETLEYGKEYIKQEANNIRLPDERQAYQESYVVNATKIGNQIIGYVKTDNQKATYAENGTGIVGSRHPNTAIKGWTYDMNKHGEAGWNYMGSDGKMHHTKGIPAQKIYYNASIQMRDKLKELILKALK